MRVYLDNASTTPLDEEVLDAMLPVLKDGFGNPSSTHSYGRKIKSLIERARKNVAKHINCTPGEIFFTSGGTEADNMAIRCAEFNIPAAIGCGASIYDQLADKNMIEIDCAGEIIRPCTAH